MVGVLGVHRRCFPFRLFGVLFLMEVTISLPVSVHAPKGKRTAIFCWFRLCCVARDEKCWLFFVYFLLPPAPGLPPPFIFFPKRGKSKRSRLPEVHIVSVQRMVIAGFVLEHRGVAREAKQEDTNQVLSRFLRVVSCKSASVKLSHFRVRWMTVALWQV